MKIKTESIINLQDKSVKLWHKDNDFLLNYKNEFYNIVLNQHLFNIKLWHLEDQARRQDISNAKIAQIKREIDKTNQARNDAIEKIDAVLLKLLEKVKVKSCASFNSETPGSIIDRLSILSLKIYHMREETKRKDIDNEYIQLCRKKLKIFIEQRKDLSFCLNELLNELFSGKKRMKVYYQFKMYNDPKSNPAIYRKENVNV